MQISFLKLKPHVVAVLAATALLLISAFLGLKSGQRKAQAKSVYATVQALSKGLENFFNDQDRFPDSSEFADSEVLLVYFTRLPYNVSQSPLCAENFIYKRDGLRGYELDFCLATGINGYSKGWNKINEQK